MSWNVLDWPGADFLAFYVLALVIAFAAAVALRHLALSGGRPPDTNNLSTMEIAFLEGGRERACDTLVLERVARGDAKIEAGGIEVSASSRSDDPSSIVAPGRYSRGQLLRAFSMSSTASTLEDTLVRRRLVPSAGQRRRAVWALAVPIGLVLCLGAAKMFVGLSRDKPIGFLTFFVLLGAFFLYLLHHYGPKLTAKGTTALAALRADNARLIRAPVAAEIPLAFAFTGATALVGSFYAAYARMIPQPGSSAASGSGCGSSSGCGGGGGGGCGGCSSS